MGLLTRGLLSAPTPGAFENNEFTGQETHATKVIDAPVLGWLQSPTQLVAEFVRIRTSHVPLWTLTISL